jgi:XTP/dITP diphosphohydrolase
MLKILIATGNKHKVQELSHILPDKTNGGRLIKYLSFKDFPNISQPEETGETLSQNAIIKAKAGMLGSGLISIADDTGLAVDILGGAPGARSARYAFENKTDYAANNAKLLEELRHVPLQNRLARFITIAALAKTNGEIILKEGIVEGSISQNYGGQNGFGYDPLFIVKSLNKTMAELTLEEKNKISHRAKAFEQMSEVIKKL